MKHLKNFNESFVENNFTIIGEIESSYPNGQKTPDFHLVSNNKTLSGTSILFDRSINKYSIPTGVKVKIIGTTKDGNNPRWNNPIYVSKIEDVIINEGIGPIIENDNKDVKSFSDRLKEASDLLFHRHEITKNHQIFSKENQKIGINNLNKWNSLYEKGDEEEKSIAIKMFNSFYNWLIDYIDNYKQILSTKNKEDDFYLQKLQKIEKEKIELENSYLKKQKKTFDETFKPLLDECQKNYKQLKDKNVVSKLDELFSIIYKNYNSNKYEQAIDGASRLVVVFFPDKTFHGWDNKSTELGLSSDNIVKLLDDYKEQINTGEPKK
jgi:hypothetical protein